MMWLMLQQDKPDDYVVGTGESHSVREFVETAFSYAGIELEWVGSGVSEKGIIASFKNSSTFNVLSSELNQKLQTSNIERRTLNVGDVVIEIDPRYFRPTEVEHLQADITKARQKLNWQPRVTFHELVKIMVDYDLKMVGIEPPGEGISTCQEKNFCYTEHAFATNELIRER